MKKIITLCFLMALVCAKGLGQTNVPFTYNTSNPTNTQSWTVPTGVNSITVRVWGAGGAGSLYTSSPYAGAGGSGAFLKGTLSVSPGQILTIAVGGGGTVIASGGATNLSAGGAFGGGTSGGGYGGSGGGFSGIFNSTTLSQNSSLVIAGGGGGGGWYSAATYGGAGGATVGSSAGILNSNYTGGTGATTAVNGYGTGGLYNSIKRGGDGSSLQGGAGGLYYYGGGGGGGGYYGGGGGYGEKNAGNNFYSSGGGGGSSFYTNSSFTLLTNTSGTTNSGSLINQAPGSSETGYINGIGNGGSGYNSTSASAGGNGLVVISYTPPTTPTLGVSATSLAFGSICYNSILTKTFTLSGSNLTGDVTVSNGGSSNFTISKDGISYGSTLTYTASAVAASPTVYVKFAPATTTSYSATVTASGGGATATTVTATGNGVNTAPTATTGSTNSITTTSATVAGSYVAGCTATTVYGIEYSTTASNLGGGTGATKVPSTNQSSGSFTSPLASLSSNTLYYYDAYATSTGGTGYGAQASFTTLPGCAAATAPANNATGICTIPPAFTWTAPGGTATTGYKFYLGTDGSGTTTPTNLLNGTSVGNILTYTPPVTLASNTTYYWQVVAVNAAGSATSCSIQKFTTVTSSTGAVAAPYTQNFECTNDLNFVNGTSQPNYWVIGTATNNGGTHSAYVTNDGSTYTYSIGTSSTVHLYKDVTFPAANGGTISFDWKGSGESGYDRLLVYAAPTSVTPTAGNPASNSTALTGATLLWTQPSSSQSSFTTATIPLSTTNIGNASASATVRIIFTWQNDDNSGSAPPVAIDNISITAVPPPTIVSFTPTSGCSSSATSVMITGTNLSNTTAVSFNGVNASSFTVNSATSVTAILPSTATTGPITVTTSTSSITSTSNLTIASSLPGTVGTISGSAAVCATSSQTYSISAVPSAASYAWTVPSGWTIVSGQGTTSLTATVGAIGGNLTIAATNGCGISGMSQTSNINPVSATNGTGYTEGISLYSGTIAVSSYANSTYGQIDGYLKFPLTGITSSITAATLSLTNTNTDAQSSFTNYVTGTGNIDPTNTTASTLYNTINNGTIYNAQTWTATGTITLPFNTSGIGGLQNNVSPQGYVGLGLIRSDGTAIYRFVGYAGTTPPVLSITYNSPKSLAVTVNPTPSAPTGSVTQQPTCSVGTGTITVSSPVGSQYTYSLDGSAYQASVTFAGIAPGSHNLTLYNGSCYSTATPVIVNAQPSTPAVPTTTITQPTCTVPTGSVTVNSPTGSNLQYSIDGTNYQTSTVFNTVNPGSYTVYVKNTTGGCTNNATAVVSSQPAPPTIAVASNSLGAKDQTVCAGSPIQNITFTWGGSATGYVFTSPLPAGLTVQGGGTNSVLISGTPTAAGSYTLTTSGSPCTQTSITGTIAINPLVTATISASSTPICAGSSSSVTITAGNTGGTIYYHLSTSPTIARSVSLSANAGQTLSDNVVETTTYTLDSARSGSSCLTLFTNQQVTVNVNPLPSAIGGPDFIATGKTGTYTDATTNGAWSITGAATIANTTTNPDKAVVTAGASVGTATLTYTVAYANNPTGCPVSKSINIFDNTIITYRTKQDGYATNPDTWSVLNDNYQWVDANTIPTNSDNILVRHNLSLLYADYSGVQGTSFTITDHDTTIGGVAQNVQGTLTVAPGHFFESKGSINFNGRFVLLRSDASGSGAIGVMANAIAGATNVQVERFTDGKPFAQSTGSRRAWRLITSPVTGQTIHAAWQENAASNVNVTPGYGTIISGYNMPSATVAAQQGYDFTGAGLTSSIRKYDAGLWVSLPSTGTLTPLQTEQAYMLFVRGDRSIASSTGTTTTTLRTTGTLQQGSRSTPTFTAGSPYILVGNPYASAIDFGHLIGHNADIKDQFYSWNSTIGQYGAYVLVTYSNGSYVATPDASAGVDPQQNDKYRYIPSGSGFFVTPQTSSTAGSVSFVEEDKAPSMVPPVSPFRLVTSPLNMRQLIVNLNLKNGDTSTTLADGFRAVFSPDYEGNEDDNSAVKAVNFNENLGLTRNAADFIIEARGEVKQTDTLFMHLWNTTIRAYQLQIKGDNFASAAGLHAFLEDSYLKTRQEVSLAGSVTTVDFAVNSDAASYDHSRFRIVFQNDATVLPVTLTSVKAAPASGGVNVSWTVTNETNIKRYTIERSIDGGNTYTVIGTQEAKNNPAAALTNYSGFDALPKTGDNLYRIRMEANNGQVSYSSVVKVTLGGEGEGIQITLYPNPVRANGKVSLQLANLKAGTYLVSVYSSAGQTVYQKKITIAQSNTTQSEELKLGSGLAQGSYPVRITDSKGTLIYTDKLVVGR